MKFRLEGSSDEFEVELTQTAPGCVRALINGDEIEAGIASISPEDGVIQVGRQLKRVFSTRQRDSIWVAAGPAHFELIPVEPRSSRRAHGLATPEITAPMPGKVVKLPVTEGQPVNAGDVVVVLEAMKMETALYAESAAVVREIRVGIGQMVDHGAVLLVLNPAPSSGEAESPIH